MGEAGVHHPDGVRADLLGTGPHGDVSRHLIDAWIIDEPAMPGDTDDLKARYLRALYRDLGSGYDIGPILQAEYEQLIPEGRPPLAHLLVNAWIEWRHLLGRRYDLRSQCWYHANGERCWE